MVTRTRLGSMRELLIDRASRIYSVVIPGLVLTILCEGTALLISPASYKAQADSFSWAHVPLQIVANLTFTAQCWGYEINPLSNSPFWSMSFECVYYVLFALLLYGWDSKVCRSIALLLAIAAGPAIVLLFPIWLLGCLLYDLYIWLDQKSYAFLLTTGLLAITLATCVLFRQSIIHMLLITDMRHRTEWLQHFFSPALQSRLADRTGMVPWLSRASLSFYLAGVLTSIALLWMLITIDRFFPKIPLGIATRLRRVAEGTFVLYLFHLPLLILVSSLLHGPPRFPIASATGIVVLCILAASYIDRLKLSMRTWLRVIFPT